MAQIREIDSLDLPELQPYRTLRRSQDHIERGIFVAEGEKVVRRLIASPLSVVSMLCTPEWLQKLNPQGVFNVYVAPMGLLETIVGFRLHQGIMAVAAVPQQRTVPEILSGLKHPPFFAALDGLVLSENVGVVVRNAAAFGADAILFDSTSSNPYLRRAVRNSMGTVFKIPVVEVPDLADALSDLKRTSGITIIGGHPGETEDILTADLSGAICIVLGNEGVGLSQRVLDECTRTVTIPMQNGTDSLNVASAAAVFFFEASKHRRRL